MKSCETEPRRRTALDVKPRVLVRSGFELATSRMVVREVYQLSQQVDGKKVIIKSILYITYPRYVEIAFVTIVFPSDEPTSTPVFIFNVFLNICDQRFNFVLLRYRFSASYQPKVLYLLLPPISN